MSLQDRYVSITGSASPEADRAELARCHQFVSELAKLILRRGGRLVELVSKDPRLDETRADTALTFFWTVAIALEELLHSGEIKEDVPHYRVLHRPGSLHKCVPKHHEQLWQQLIGAGVIELVATDPDAHLGGEIRKLQLEKLDALVLLGGGKGTYHLGKMALEEDVPIVPLDVGIGAYNADGDGSLTHQRAALNDPGRYLPGAGPVLQRAMAALSMRSASSSPLKVAHTVSELLDKPNYAKRTPRDVRAVLLVVVPVELKAAFHVLGIDSELLPHLTERETRVYAVAPGIHLVAVGGAGNPNAANVASELLSKFKPDLMILSGIAGGDEETTTLGTVVIADQVIGYEQGAVIGGDDARTTRRPVVFRMGHGCGSVSDGVASGATSPV